MNWGFVLNVTKITAIMGKKITKTKCKLLKNYMAEAELYIFLYVVVWNISFDQVY